MRGNNVENAESAMYCAQPITDVGHLFNRTADGLFNDNNDRRNEISGSGRRYSATYGSRYRSSAHT